MNLCDRFGIPLVVLSDTPGFLPGAAQEHAGVLRHGASLLRAFAQATVPRVTVTLRQAYGGAHIVMNSRDLGATLTLAWPQSRIGVMGARQAVELVRRREIEAGADAALLAEAYEAEHLPVRVAAAAGFMDEVIAPSGDARPHRPRPRAGARRERTGGEALANESRNATEEAILDAARDALADTRYRRLTMERIARRAYRQPHRAVLLLPQQARAGRPADPARVHGHVRGGLAVPRRRRRSARRAAPRRSRAP